MFAKRLRESRRACGLTLEELANLYNTKFGGGLNKGTLSKYENGKQEPLSGVTSNLAEILEVSTDYLLGKSEKRIPADYNRKHGDGAYREQSEFERIISGIPLYSVPVSAGTGQWLENGHEYDFVYLENVPSDADFALRVHGNSMEPLYANRDIVFVKANVIVESGQIGVFCLNGEGYMKMLQGNKLVSLNKDYPPIVVNEFDSFFCAGRVIGKGRL